MIYSAQSLVGLGLILGLCWLLSEGRREVRLLMVAKSLALQLALALLLLKLPASQQVFMALNAGIQLVQQAMQEGSQFIFGWLGGGEPPFVKTSPEASAAVLAFQTMPLVIVISALSALLMYWKILPLIMRGMSFVLVKTLEIGGAQGLGVSANAFLGMVESPLLIKPYIARLSRGELFSIMCAGMATVAGTVLALEAALIAKVVPNAIGHLISCSLITLPAAIYVSHLLVPSGKATRGEMPETQTAGSVMDAISTGTMNGLQLFLNIIAMVIVMVALVYLANAVLGLGPAVFGEPLSLERIFGALLAPLTLMMGVPWDEALATGRLMGVKLTLTEFIAYVRFSELPAEALSGRSRIIMTYALCGFANFVSLGIMVTGLVTMAPQRRDEILELGMKSLLAGTLATCTSAAMVGIIL